MLDSVRRMTWTFTLCLGLIAFGALAPRAAAAPTAASKAPVPAQAVDINAADELELQAVPGIGEATARLIVEWRKENGPFRRVEDLMKVKGIGEKSLEKLRPYVKVAQEK